MEYAVSRREIKRRIYAYLRLSISLITCTAVMFLLFPLADTTIMTLIIGLLIFFLGLLLAVTLRSFQSLRFIKVVVHDDHLERIEDNKFKKIFYKGIVAVSSTWGTRNQVREIRILTKSGKSYIFNGLERQEQLYKKLKAKLSSNAKVHEGHEPIDYDHPLFYVILGLALGVFATILFHLVFGVHGIQIDMLLIFFGIYNIPIAVYFARKFPISKRYGNSTKVLDYTFGALLLLSGLGLIVLAAM